MRLRTAVLTALIAATATAAPTLASSALTVDPVKLLAAPDTSFGVVLALDAKTKVSVIWCGPTKFDWCLIQFHKQQGWVRPADLVGVNAAGEPVDPATGRPIATTATDPHADTPVDRIGEDGQTKPIKIPPGFHL